MDREKALGCYTLLSFLLCAGCSTIPFKNPLGSGPPTREIEIYRYDAADHLFYRSKERDIKKTPLEADGMLCFDEANLRKLTDSLQASDTEAKTSK